MDQRYLGWIEPILKSAVDHGVVTVSSIKEDAQLYFDNSSRNIEMTMSHIGKGSFGPVWEVLPRLVPLTPQFKIKHVPPVSDL